jgi:hypothetical protein
VPGRGQGVRNLRDVSVNGSGCDEISLAKVRFYFHAIKVATRTVFLDSPNRARMSGAGVTLRRLFDRPSIFSRIEGRAGARLGVHRKDGTTGIDAQLAGYPHHIKICAGRTARADHHGKHMKSGAKADASAQGSGGMVRHVQCVGGIYGIKVRIWHRINVP